MAEDEQKPTQAPLARLEDPPRAGQMVEHAGKVFTTIREGLAYILVPEDAPTCLDPKQAKNGLIEAQSVFYNPIQQFNRDLSVLAIKAYGEDLMELRKSKADQKAQRTKHRATRHETRGVKRKADEALASSGRADDSETASHMIEVQSKPASIEPNGFDTAVTHAANPTIMAAKELPNHPDQDKDTNPATVIAGAEANLGTQQSQLQDGDENRDPKRDQLHYKRSFKILDALSASGLRALRYAQEIPLATSITANDLSPQAVDSIVANVKYNKQERKIRSLAGNALTHMYNFAGKSTEGDAKYEARYDVIDLDPYGTAAPFLDAAMHALNDGGLLCVTCTDAGVWASCGYPEKAYSLYGGTPAKGIHGHEGGLRLILHAVASSAARQGMSIEPLLTLSIDFYARAFIRVYRSAAEVKLLAGKTMLVYNCDAGCGAWQTQFLARNQPFKGKDGKVANYKHSLGQVTAPGSKCEHCGFKLHLSGPMYGGMLHHPAFIEAILGSLEDADRTTYATTDRIKGMLTTALEETILNDDGQLESQRGTHSTQQQISLSKSSRPIPRADPAQIDPYPFYFNSSILAKVLHCQAPPENAVRGALRHAGYHVTRSHAKPGTTRTNAPWTFVWEMMREWVRQKAPIKEGAIRPGTPGWGIMKNREADGAKHDSAEQKDDMNGGEKHKEAGAGESSDKMDLDGNVPKKEQGTSLSENEGGEVPKSQPKHGRGVVFDEKLGREEARGHRLVRYPVNPRANWGPMNRARKGKEKSADDS